MSIPLHAAGIYSLNNTDSECCADYVVSSYTPTLTALLRAQESSPGFHRDKVKLGLVAALNAWDPSLPTLWNVQDEVSYVQSAATAASIFVDNSNSCEDHATLVPHVAEVFKSTNLVHIACHGIQNPDNALSSGFCLSDGDLTVSHLMHLDLKDAFFCFLECL
jgi:CHAT domain-containing protein